MKLKVAKARFLTEGHSTDRSIDRMGHRWKSHLFYFEKNDVGLGELAAQKAFKTWYYYSNLNVKVLGTQPIV